MTQERKRMTEEKKGRLKEYGDIGYPSSPEPLKRADEIFTTDWRGLREMKFEPFREAWDELVERVEQFQQRLDNMTEDEEV